MDDKDRANLTRWDGRAGWYEVYYLKFNNPVDRTACWIRYTLTSPSKAKGEGRCELWGIFFDAADPSANFAVKNSFNIDRLSLQKDKWKIMIGDAELSSQHARGSIGGKGAELSWDLTFGSTLPVFHHFPLAGMYEWSFPKTKALAPHENALFKGKIDANGREILVEDAPGQQAHLWGTKHALRWAWCHCSAFAGEEDAVFEGLDSRIKLGTITSPHLALFYLRLRGRDHYLNTIPHLFKNRSRWELGHWSFSGRDRDVEVKGEVRCRTEEMVGVTYQDPDGELLWCNNSKTAVMELEVFFKDGGPVRLKGDMTAAAEFVDRRTYPEVPIRI